MEAGIECTDMLLNSVSYRGWSYVMKEVTKVFWGRRR